MVEQIEEIARRVAVFAVAQGLFAVERRQRRTGTDQADQVEAQARAHLPVLFEKLHAIDIAARKSEARVGLEFHLVVQILFAQVRVRLAQPVDYQQHGLKQRVLAYYLRQPA